MNRDMSPSEAGSLRAESALGRDLADLRWLSELARSLLRDADLADDACQEVWLAASREGSPTFDRGRLALLLRRFAWRTRRADRRRRRREAEAARPESCPPVDEFLALGEQRVRLWQHLRCLEEPFRTTLLLRFQEELPTSEIAKELRVTPDTIRWRIRRGLQLLRTSLEHDENGGLTALAIVVPASPEALISSQKTLLSAASATAFGTAGLVMSKLVPAAVLIAAVVTAWLSYPREGDSGAEGVASVEPVPTSELESSELAVNPADQSVRDSERRVVRVPEAGEVALHHGPAVLMGRVIRADGSSVEGAVLVLSGRSWTSEAVAETDGSFRLEIPTGGAPKADLVVKEAEHLCEAHLTFSDDGGDFEALDATSGTSTDVGEIRLGQAGVVTGRLVPADPAAADAVGARVEGVWVYAGPSSVQTGPNGEFVAPHVPVGECSVELSAPGFLELERTVNVSWGGRADLGVIELAVAPRVRGQVVSSLGHALPDAKVSSRGLRRGWVFDVDDEGRFDVPLPGLRDGELTAYAPQHEQPYFDIPVRPGAEDVRIVLENVGQACSIQVVDAASGAPVSFFCIEVDRQSASRRRDYLSPRVTYRPSHEREFRDGRARFSGEPGKDVIEIAAAGYRSTATILTADALTIGQVIELGAPTRTTGRVLSDGVPVSGARVILQSSQLAECRPEREGLDRVEALAASSLAPQIRAQGGRGVIDVRTTGEVTAPALCLLGDVPAGAMEERECLTDDEGRFLFEGDLDGAFRIHVIAESQGVQSDLYAVPVTGGMDLGDLELTPLTRLAGSITPLDVGLMVSGELAGCNVSIPALGLATTTDDQGHFELERLIQGRHLLRVESAEHLYCRPNRVHVYVEHDAASQKELSIDLNMRPAAIVHARVRINGVEPIGARVRIRSDDGEESAVTIREDEVPVLRLPAQRPLSPSITIDRATIHFGQPVTFASDRPNEVEWNLVGGSLEVKLADDVPLAHDELAELSWKDADALERRPPMRGELTGQAGRTAVFAFVPVDASELRLRLRSPSTRRQARVIPIEARIVEGSTVSVEAALDRR